MDGAHHAGNDPLGGAIEPVSILKALLTGFLDLKTRKVVKMYIEWNFFWSKYLINGLSAHVLVKVHFARYRWGDWWGRDSIHAPEHESNPGRYKKV